MRCLLLVSSLSIGLAPLAGCGPRAATDVKSTPPPSADAAPAAPAGPACEVKSRRVSAAGRGGVRPVIAAGPGGFAVVWEETADNHRGIRFQALDAQAQPISANVEVADLTRGGAEPRVVADGDGYAVLWTVDSADHSVIQLRRVDAHGKPRGDVVPAISAPGARALAATRVEDGFAVAWWTWSANPPQQSLTWLDPAGKPRGKPVLFTRGSLVEPEVDLQPLGAAVRATWVEPVSGVDHVFTGEIHPSEGAGSVKKRVDVGVGNTPSLMDAAVVYANLSDATVWRSPIDAARPTRLVDGQSPDVAGDTVCLFRSQREEERSFDALHCVAIAEGRAARDAQILTSTGGVLTLRTAEAGGVTGIAYQTEEGEEMAVAFVAAQCAKKR